MRNIFSITTSGWIWLTCLNALIVFLIALPFVPGPSMVPIRTLGMIAQFTAFFGFILAPPSILLLLILIFGAKSESQLLRKVVNWLSITSLALAMVAIFLCEFAAIASDKISGFILAIPFALLLKLAFSSIRYVPFAPLSTRVFFALLFITLPLTSYLTRVTLEKPLSNFSRNHAIENSAPLITAIESFKSNEGSYPPTMELLVGKYINEVPLPGIIGIEKFRYNNIDNEYSLSFSQWLEWGSLEEIALYDKSNIRNNLTGKYAVYDYKFDLCRIKGAFAQFDTRDAHWKYYHLD
jgi:hypothetical protein